MQATYLCRIHPCLLCGACSSPRALLHPPTRPCQAFAALFPADGFRFGPLPACLMLPKQALMLMCSSIPCLPDPLLSFRACHNCTLGSFLSSDDAQALSLPALLSCHSLLTIALSQINPDDVVNQFGADSLRLYEMFMGPLRDSKVGG